MYHDRSHLNLFRSISVATGNTLSRVPSTMSTASQELHRKCHFWPVSKSCTTTLLTYLHIARIINFCAQSNDTNSSLTLVFSPLTHTPCRVISWVVVPQSYALQISKRKVRGQQKHIQPTSLKHRLLRVCQVVGLTFSLCTQKSYGHLEQKIIISQGLDSENF